MDQDLSPTLEDYVETIYRIERASLSARRKPSEADLHR